MLLRRTSMIPMELPKRHAPVHRARPQKKFAPLVLCVLAVACLAVSCAKPKTLTFKTDDTAYSVSFDSAQIPEREMRNLIILSPVVTDYVGVPGPGDFTAVGSINGNVHDKALVAVPLELCLEADAAYTHCYHNDIGSPDFLHNASVNLEKSRQGLAWLRALQYPSDLQPVVTFLERGLASSIAIEEAKFKYYSTWDDKVLAQPLNDLHPEDICSNVFKTLRAARTEPDKYSVVRTQWTNCVLQHAPRGRYPTDVWDKFLRDYRIKETYNETGAPD